MIEIFVSIDGAVIGSLPRKAQSRPPLAKRGNFLFILRENTFGDRAIR
jgi:hypothetical protein